jgi:hypothetical protein
MFEFGDEIRIVNDYNQTGTATVIRQDGDTLTVDYLGCMHEFDVSRVLNDN